MNGGSTVWSVKLSRALVNVQNLTNTEIFTSRKFFINRSKTTSMLTLISIKHEIYTTFDTLLMIWSYKNDEGNAQIIKWTEIHTS